MAKKLHWTQTPEGRARQSARMKRQWRDGTINGRAKRPAKKRAGTRPATTYPKRGAARGHQHRTNPAQELDLHVAYAFGRAQGLIHSYAEALGVPGEQLANRVGQLLQDPAGGGVRGPGHPLP